MRWRELSHRVEGVEDIMRWNFFSAVLAYQQSYAAIQVIILYPFPPPPPNQPHSINCCHDFIALASSL